MLTYASGNRVTGTWVKDRLNGPGELKNKGKGAIPVVFQNDMAVTGQVGQAECGTWFYAVFAATLQIACYTLIIIGFVFGDYFKGYGDSDAAAGWWMLAALSLIINLIYGCCTDSTNFMCNKMKLDECMGNIHTAIKNPPTMTMHI